MSARRASSTAAMYSAGVVTSSCPFIFIRPPPPLNVASSNASDHVLAALD